MLRTQQERRDPIGVAYMWAWLSLVTGVIGTAIALAVISNQKSSCVDDAFSGTTCPPFVHNYLAAYLISGVTSAIFTGAVLFIIIARAVEVGVRASR